MSSSTWVTVWVQLHFGWWLRSDQSIRKRSKRCSHLLLLLIVLTSEVSFTNFSQSTVIVLRYVSKKNFSCLSFRLFLVVWKWFFFLQKVMTLLGRYEIDPSGPVLKALAARACDDKSWSQPLCTNIMFLIGGFGSDQLNTTMLPVLLAHVPAGGAVRHFVHYFQIIRDREFSKKSS